MAARLIWHWGSELAQTLDKMGSSLTMIFSPNSLQIVKWEAQAGGMQVWAYVLRCRKAAVWKCIWAHCEYSLSKRTIPQGTLFSSFRISSPLPGSEIPLDLRLEDLVQAMKSAQEFQNVSLQLVKKANPVDPRQQAYLEFVMGYDVSSFYYCPRGKYHSLDIRTCLYRISRLEM